jgi:hypothetical protein
VSGRILYSPVCAAAALCICSLTADILKLAPFCIGGNSMGFGPLAPLMLCSFVFVLQTSRSLCLSAVTAGFRLSFSRDARLNAKRHQALISQVSPVVDGVFSITPPEYVYVLDGRASDPLVDCGSQ